MICYLRVTLSGIADINDEITGALDLVQELPPSAPIIHAPLANVDRFPFVIGFVDKKRNDKIGHYAHCTGAVIAKKWAVTAAHCLFQIIQKRESIQKCLKDTRKHNSFKGKKGTIKCKRMETGDVKIEFADHPAMAYHGIGDIKDEEIHDQGHLEEIDYLIRHEYSYTNAGVYGSYGGYDIILLHFKRHVQDEYKPICLPGPTYKDSGIGPSYSNNVPVTIGGYGSFTRPQCKTDEFGELKHHFCVTNTTCNEINPPPQSDDCNALQTYFKTNVSHSTEEILLKEMKSGQVHHCYRQQSPRPGSRGWCRVEKDANKIGSLKKTDSWGFCSAECYLNHAAIRNESKSIFRTKHDVSVLDEHLCNKFLYTSLDKSAVKHMPQILCIGYIEPLKFDIWVKEESGHLRPAPELDTLKHKITKLTDLDSYVYSAGICYGDSGGPAFIEEDKTGKVILIGIASGGRGKLMNCGGLNNPTHYVRIKEFTDWIVEVTDQEDKAEFCWSD